MNGQKDVGQQSQEKPGFKQVNFGDFRRVQPISRAFGFERGNPVDRYYIECFLERHSLEIQGRVLEMGDSDYTVRFGGERVLRSDVLDHNPDNHQATILADLAKEEAIPEEIFDCFIFTQTLQYIYQLRPAIRSIYRLLKPGGVLLATFPVISQICRYDMDRWGDYWRFTSASVSRLLGEVFPVEQLEVHSHGNVLAALCLLHGLAAEEITSEELDFFDPDYQILITARAVKP